MNRLATTQLPDGRTIAHMNPTETWLIHDEIFGEEIYNRGGASLHDGATVVDIGGNIGLFLLWATDRHRDLTIHTFEPIPETFEVLSSNRDRVRDAGHRITLHNQGVWKETTEATFRHLPRFSCSSTMCPDDSPEQQARALEFTLNAFEQHPSKLLRTFLSCLPSPIRHGIAKWLIRRNGRHREVRCQLISFTDLIRQCELDRIDYLKLDAEGAEIEILESISEDDWPRIRQISVETHRGEESMRAVESILRSNGFATQTSFSQSSPADKMVYGTRDQAAAEPNVASEMAVGGG